MTPAEWQAMSERRAARAAVLAKWNDGTAVITDEDCKHLYAEEITQLMNAGRFGPEVGADKRLARQR
jgi:hypothetical protein